MSTHRPLTPREESALIYICSHVELRGYPPTAREIATHLGCSSQTSGMQVLTQLRSLGIISPVRGSGSARARAYTVLTPA